MAARERLICAAADLDGERKCVRFDLPERGERVSGFVLRYNEFIRAYINRCAHVPVELDWNEGDFFDLTGHYLLCATHGAHYEPDSGRCVLGPCRGKHLEPLAVAERDGNIYLIIES